MAKPDRLRAPTRKNPPDGVRRGFFVPSSLYRSSESRFRREMEVAFDLHPQRAPVREEFREPETPEFLREAVHEPEEDIVPVEFDPVPGPGAVRIEELHPTEGIGVLLRRAQGREGFPHGLRQEFIKRHRRVRVERIKPEDSTRQPLGRQASRREAGYPPESSRVKAHRTGWNDRPDFSRPRTRWGTTAGLP